MSNVLLNIYSVLFYSVSAVPLHYSKRRLN